MTLAQNPYDISEGTWSADFQRLRGNFGGPQRYSYGTLIVGFDDALARLARTDYGAIAVLE